ncbi:MAG: CsbD family protein [Arenicellales bacterium]
MNKDQVRGHITEAKGKVKEVTGKAFSKDLTRKGRMQKTRGKVQAAYGDLKEYVRNAVNDK